MPREMSRVHRRATGALLALAMACSLFGRLIMPIVYADTAYFNLSAGNFSQDWSNTGLITTNDDYSGVPSITGYRGDNGAQANDADPRTISANLSIITDVVANQTNTDPAAGGVFEIEGGNPVIGLNGSGTADSPNLVIYLNTTGRTSVSISYNVRDLDASADDNVKQVALQYRVARTDLPPDVDETLFFNVTDGTNTYIADATTVNSATRVTAVSATLPAAALNQPEVEVRIITTNSTGK